MQWKASSKTRLFLSSERIELHGDAACNLWNSRLWLRLPIEFKWWLLGATTHEVDTGLLVIKRSKKICKYSFSCMLMETFNSKIIITIAHKHQYTHDMGAKIKAQSSTKVSPKQKVRKRRCIEHFITDSYKKSSIQYSSFFTFLAYFLCPRK